MIKKVLLFIGEGFLITFSLMDSNVLFIKKRDLSGIDILKMTSTMPILLGIMFLLVKCLEN